MKKILLFILIIVSANCFGQVRRMLLMPIPIEQPPVAIKNYSDTSGKYFIRYVYNGSSAFIHKNKMHYDAKIAVYKTGIDTILVGEVFRGVYVAENCTDDNPKEQIKKAKKLKDNR